MKTAIALTLVATVSGCSFFVQGPRDDYSSKVDGPPECNRHWGGSRGVDIVGAIFGSIVTAVAISAAEDNGGNTEWAFAATGAIGTGLHLGAMLSAASKVERCNDADQKYKSWLRESAAPPPVTTTGPPGSTAR